MIGGIVSAGIAADQENGVRAGNVFQRERQAPVNAERFDARRRLGGHAEAPVVINVGRSQRDAGELAEQIRLLVGQAAAAEDADGVPPVRVPDAREFRARSGPAPFPGRGPQRLALAVAHQRRGQAVRVREQVGSRPALLAQSALVGGEVRARRRRSAGAVAVATRFMPHCRAQ